MFKYSLDKKKEVTDTRGNKIIDLTKSIFARKSGTIKDYKIVRMSDVYEMRPDLVSQAMYETDEFTEFILKFAGISNPFTLSEDDVLLIPNDAQAEGMMAANAGDDDTDNTKSAGTMAQIRQFFKFVNTEYRSDSTSYDNLKNMKIPSGVIDTTQITQGEVPYISDDGRTAVTIRNGRVYFGEDSGMNIASVPGGGDQSTPTVTGAVQSILNNALTQLSDSNCLYNGMTLADFFRGNVVNKIS